MLSPRYDARLHLSWARQEQQFRRIRPPSRRRRSNGPWPSRRASRKEHVVNASFLINNIAPGCEAQCRRYSVAIFVRLLMRRRVWPAETATGQEACAVASPDEA